MVEYSGGKLPREVSMAAGTVGMKLTEIAEYRVGEDVVVLLNKKGQKFVFELVKLAPEREKSETARKTRKTGTRKRAQKELMDVAGKPRGAG